MTANLTVHGYKTTARSDIMKCLHITSRGVLALILAGAMLFGVLHVLEVSAASSLTGLATNSPDLAIITNPFIPISDIIGVPNEILAGTPHTLSGTVLPFNATNQDIIWKVKDTGSCGASISGDVLTTIAAGEATITATVAEGLKNTIASIAVGSVHGLALVTDGSLWAWGNNIYGQIDRKSVV
jgi:hypothetical protein